MRNSADGRLDPVQEQPASDAGRHVTALVALRNGQIIVVTQLNVQATAHTNQRVYDEVTADPPQKRARWQRM